MLGAIGSVLGLPGIQLQPSFDEDWVALAHVFIEGLSRAAVASAIHKAGLLALLAAGLVDCPNACG